MGERTEIEVDVPSSNINVIKGKICHAEMDKLVTSGKRVRENGASRTK